MTVSELVNIAFAIIGSIGSAGLIVLALSNWLGQVWANRLMEDERAKNEIQLKAFQSDLEKANNEALSRLESNLSIYKEKHLKGFYDKLEVYRLLIEMVSEILGDFDNFHLTNQPYDAERLDKINRARLKVYGYLGIVAPQEVMDAHDNLIDYLLLVAHGNEKYVWVRVRELSIAFLNQIRIDVGIDSTPIQYNGKL